MGEGGEGGETGRCCGFTRCLLVFVDAGDSEGIGNRGAPSCSWGTVGGGGKYGTAFLGGLEEGISLLT